MVYVFIGLADIQGQSTPLELRRKDLDRDPIKQFHKWFDQAQVTRTSGQIVRFLVKSYRRLQLLTGVEPTVVHAMTLSTVDADGQPSSRIVLLTGAEERG